MHKIKDEYCKICPNSCHKDNLMCGRGRAYFSNESDEFSDKHGHKNHHEFFHEHGHEHHHKHGHKHGKKHLMKLDDYDIDFKEMKHFKKHKEHYFEMNLENRSLYELVSRVGLIARLKRDHHGGQYGIINLLEKHGDISQQNLREMLGIEAGSMSELLNKLEVKGLLERSTDESDRRCQIVHLTELGEELAKKNRAKEDDGEDMFEVLSEDEKENLKNILVKLLEKWHSDRKKRD